MHAAVACTQMKKLQQHVMRAVRDHKLVLPDSLFLYNIVDWPPCLDIRGKVRAARARLACSRSDFTALWGRSR